MKNKLPIAHDLPYIQGWFQIGWSDEVKPGSLLKVHYFGRNYALFRGADGQLGLLDDICPHLGASLTAGGQVIGSSVRCPYHHWAFDRTGQCTSIPYAKRIPARSSTTCHQVVERYGMIFMYRDQHGGQPAYPLHEIQDIDFNEYSAPEKWQFQVRVAPQDIMENTVDSPHFRAVHGHSMPINTLRTEGTRLLVTQEMSQNYFGFEFKMKLHFNIIEPGFETIFFPNSGGVATMLVFSSMVPVDKEYTMHRLTVWVKTAQIPIWNWLVRKFIVWQMRATYLEDVHIWENKVYLPHPQLCDGDGDIMKIRRWFSQFYDK